MNNENRANLSLEQLVFWFGNINLPLIVNGVLFPGLKYTLLQVAHGTWKPQLEIMRFAHQPSHGISLMFKNLPFITIKIETKFNFIWHKKLDLVRENKFRRSAPLKFSCISLNTFSSSPSFFVGLMIFVPILGITIVTSLVSFSTS